MSRRRARLRDLAVAAALAIAGAAGVTAAVSSDGAALELRLAGETATTVTLAWTPPADAAGYVFVADGRRVSRTYDPTRASVRFSRGPVRFEVQVLTVGRTGTWPPPATTTTAPAGVTVQVPAWSIRLETKQTDPSSGPGNRYTFGWIKTARPVPPGVGTRGWETEGLVELADYPDEMVLVEAKRFDVGYPGRTTNFHLVGGDAAHGGVSPLSLDWHQGRGLEIVGQAEGDGSNRPYHWPVATEQELTVNRQAVWTLVWRIRWRRDTTGYVKLSAYRDGQLIRTVDTGLIRTVYVEQKPRVYVWQGGYESAGLASPAQVTQTLDYRGRTLAEAVADRPQLGQTIRSVSTVGGPASSVNSNGTLTIAIP